MVMMNKKSANRGFDCFQKGFLGQGVHCGTLEMLEKQCMEIISEEESSISSLQKCIGFKQIYPQVPKQHTAPTPAKPVPITGVICTGAGLNLRCSAKPQDEELQGKYIVEEYINVLVTD